jgi:cyclohexyl-isocyanide hydratase
MNRRELALALGSAAFAAGLRGHAALAAQPGDQAAAGATTAPPHPKVAMLVYPDMILLDLVGAQTMLSIAMADIHLVWKNLDPVSADVGLPVSANTSFATCPAELDVLFVPGGLKGTVALMRDKEVLDFLANRGARARYVTSVCTGSLALGAAGLLNGYRATSHWYVRDLLPLMGAIVAPDRVVVDRNRITGGGVTAGLDFGLTLVAALRGDEYARRIQLLLVSAPKPPFDAGEPESAGSTLVQEVLDRRMPLIAAARSAIAGLAGAPRK